MTLVNIPTQQGSVYARIDGGDKWKVQTIEIITVKTRMCSNMEDALTCTFYSEAFYLLNTCHK